MILFCMQKPIFHFVCCLIARFQLQLVYLFFLFVSSLLIRFSLLFIDLALTVDNLMFLLFHYYFHQLLQFV